MPSGNTFGDHTFRKCLHLQTSKPKLSEAREALNDHAHRCIDVQVVAVSHIERGEWQLPHACKHRVTPYHSHYRCPKATLTFWEGLQLLAVREIECLERGAIADTCSGRIRHTESLSMQMLER